MIKRIFLSVFIANMLLLLVSLVILPDKVAIHFGWGGLPDSWASKELNALLFCSFMLPFFLLLWFLSAWITRIPPKYISLPNRDYWLRAQNRGRMIEKLDSAFSQFGAVFYLFMFCLQLITMDANLSQPVLLNEAWLFSILALFVFYTLFWTIRLYRLFGVSKPGTI